MKKILLVEDDPDHAELTKEVLGEHQNESDIILVRDGQEAIDYFQEVSIKLEGELKNKIKLIILDLNLPKIDGMEVLKFLKNNSKFSQIPVVISSTSSNPKTIDEAYDNGANGYVIKHDSYEDFVKKLKKLKEYC